MSTPKFLGENETQLLAKTAQGAHVIFEKQLHPPEFHDYVRGLEREGGGVIDHNDIAGQQTLVPKPTPPLPPTPQGYVDQIQPSAATMRMNQLQGTPNRNVPGIASGMAGTTTNNPADPYPVPRDAKDLPPVPAASPIPVPTPPSDALQNPAMSPFGQQGALSGPAGAPGISAPQDPVDALMARNQAAGNQRIGALGNAYDQQRDAVGEVARLKAEDDRKIHAEMARSNLEQANQDKKAQDFQLYKENVARFHTNDLVARQNQIDSMKVNPDRFWQSRGTLAQVGAGIAVALGGIGAAFNRDGRNVAMDMINKGIDQDLELQKEERTNARENMADRRGIYHMIDQGNQDKQVAMLAARQNMLEATKRKVELITLGNADQMTMANAHQLQSQISVEQQKVQQEIASRVDAISTQLAVAKMANQAQREMMNVHLQVAQMSQDALLGRARIAADAKAQTAKDKAEAARLSLTLPGFVGNTNNPRMLKPMAEMHANTQQLTTLLENLAAHHGKYGMEILPSAEKTKGQIMAEAARELAKKVGLDPGMIHDPDSIAFRYQLPDAYTNLAELAKTNLENAGKAYGFPSLRPAGSVPPSPGPQPINDETARETAEMDREEADGE